MCGICGYYGRKNADKPLPINLLQHRGPDGQGEFFGNNYSFGHTRLAIIDVEHGKQPMYNEDGSVCITFNGEIYNYQTLLDSLKQNHNIKTDCDTEIILHLYEERGVDGLMELDGMYALAIRTPDTFILARDPLGIKPLYFQRTKSSLSFASELKAFTRARALGGMENVEEFPPGTIYEHDKGFLSSYNLPEHYQNDLRWQDSLEMIENRLELSVEKRLMSDVPLGSFLSGGLDSSLITALVKKSQDQLHTFSVTLEKSNDRYYSKMVSKYLGTIHHELVLTSKEMWEALPEIIYYLESFDQSLVRSAVANYFLAKIASDYVKVVLTGEGADELFAGYDYLHGLNEWDELHRELLEITGELHNTNLQRVDRMTMAHGLEARVPFLDVELIDVGLTIPPWHKRNDEGIVKWCLREAFCGRSRAGKDLLPEEIIFREKEKFAEGTGVADLLSHMAEEFVPDDDYHLELQRGTPLRSKEEYHYYKLFCSCYGRENALNLVGRSRS